MLHSSVRELEEVCCPAAGAFLLQHFCWRWTDFPHGDVFDGWRQLLEVGRFPSQKCCSFFFPSLPDRFSLPIVHSRTLRSLESMTNAPVLWMDLLSLAMISYADPKIYAGSDKYHYRGCYNETAHLPHTPGERAVAPGTNHVFANSMTVPMCLDFCDPGDKAYRYAGMEYSQDTFSY